MSRATVRAALYNFFTAGCDPHTGSVPGVNRVYRAQPWYIDGKVFNLSNELGSGAVCFLHFPDKNETRISDPAKGVTPGVVGVKQVDYDVALVILYQYLIPTATQTADAVPEDAWVLPLDATLVGLEDLVHSDPTAGTGPQGVVFSMAQDPGDTRLPQELPRLLPGKVLSWQALQFNVTEMIFA